MPLADWTIFSGAFGGVSIAVSSPPWSATSVTYPANGIFNPADVVDINDSSIHNDIAIDDSKCLVMAGAGVGTIRGAHTTRVSSAVRGQITFSARIRFAYDGPGHAGICVLQDQQNMLPGAGIAYALILDTIFFNNRLRLVQLTNGISGSPGGSLGSTYILLAETNTTFFASGSVQVLRLAWESDPVRLKGTRLRVWHGLSLASLVQLWDIVYTGAAAHVPTTSAGVGCIAHVATNNFISYFDIITMEGAP